jgi:hypothetical protein
MTDASEFGFPSASASVPLPDVHVTDRSLIPHSSYPVNAPDVISSVNIRRNAGAVSTNATRSLVMSTMPSNALSWGRLHRIDRFTILQHMATSNSILRRVRLYSFFVGRLLVVVALMFLFHCHKFTWTHTLPPSRAIGLLLYGSQRLVSFKRMLASIGEMY